MVPICSLRSPRRRVLICVFRLEIMLEQTSGYQYNPTMISPRTRAVRCTSASTSSLMPTITAADWSCPRSSVAPFRSPPEQTSASIYLQYRFKNTYVLVPSNLPKWRDEVQSQWQASLLGRRCLSRRYPVSMQRFRYRMQSCPVF